MKNMLMLLTVTEFFNVT